MEKNKNVLQTVYENDIIVKNIKNKIRYLINKV